MNRPTLVKVARLLRGLSLLEVELSTGIDDTRLSRIERGLVTADDRQVAALAELYNAPASSLFAKKAGEFVPLSQGASEAP